MSVSSIIDSATGKIYDNLIPQGGGVALTKGQLISANDQNPPVEVAVPVGVNGTILMADSTQVDGLRWAVVPGAVPLAQGQLLSGNLAGDPTIVVAPVLPAQAGWVLSADGTAGAAGTNMEWKPATGGGGLLTANLPLFDDATTTPNTIGINFSNTVGEIPYGTATRVGALTNIPTSGTQFLGVVAGVPAWKDIGASGSITATFPLIESAGLNNASNIAIDYSAKGDLTVGASSTAGAPGVILPVGATDGQVLEVFAGAPSGMRWATPAPPSGGPTINRSSKDTQEILPPQSLNETMILVAEEPTASWDAILSQGDNDPGTYQIEFTTPFYQGFQQPAANDSGLQGLVVMINGARCIQLDITNQGGGPLTVGYLEFDDFGAPAQVLGYIGPVGTSSLMGNSIIIVGAFTKLHYVNPATPAKFYSNIMGIDFSNMLSIQDFTPPSLNFGAVSGLAGFGPQGYVSSIQLIAGTGDYAICGKFSLVDCVPVPGSTGYRSMILYNTVANQYATSSVCLNAGLGVRLSGGPGTINDAYWDGTNSLIIVGEFDELCVDENTNTPAPAASHGLAKWLLTLTPGTAWSTTPTGAPTAVPDGICCRPMVSQGAGVVCVCGGSGIPVAYNIATGATNALTGTYPVPAIPFGYNCVVGGTTDLGGGQLAQDIILYQDTTNNVCYCYYFTAANGTASTALTPIPTGFIPDTTGGILSNCGIYLFFDVDPLVPVFVVQVGAKDSIYRYDAAAHGTLVFTLGTPATPLIGFYENGTLYHTATFTAANGGHESQSYIANQGKTSWIQIGAKTAGLTYT